jgi:hypothetical protein
METRTARQNRSAALSILMILGLCGCDDGYTIHSIYQSSPGPSSVPDVTGLWQSSEPGWHDSVLQIAAQEYDVDHCRSADIRMLDLLSNADDKVIGDEICFVPIAGHMIMEVRNTGTVRLYQHFLVKIDQQSIISCGSIWGHLLALHLQDPVRVSMEGLEYTIRSSPDSGNELIVVSPTDALRTYLEVNVPKIASLCDEGDEEGPRWISFKRLTPARVSEAAEER